MKLNRKPLSAAVISALVSLTAPAYAQTPAPTSAEVAAAAKKAEDAKKAASQSIDQVVVTGIRASLEKSLEVKRNSGANVEVITAEDVGKMPDKNIADSLQRLTGVAVRTDYDEAEKVSLRGTNPDMSLILFNGHTVSGGDWFVADQASSSRSTSLSLLPSSVLNQAQVYKTSQANIVDGGLAGTINVTTRKPLDQKSKFSGQVNVGATYATLPDKTSPNLNANFNWKNDAKNFGIIAQVFSEKRYMRRDSVSRNAQGTNSGWGEIDISTMRGITDASLAGTGLKAADLNGVRLPGSLSSEFVEGVRDRTGGMVAAQYRPNGQFDVTVTGFHSSMNANNFGRLTSGAIYSMLLGKGENFGATAATSLNTSSGARQVFAFIRNPVIINTTSNYGFPLRVLQSAEIVFPDGTTPQYVGNSEGFYRNGAVASSGFLDVDTKYRVNDDWVINGLFSTTRGVGSTALDQGATFARFGTGISYALNGLYKAPDVSYRGAGTNQPGLNADGSGYKLVRRGAASNRTIDREDSLALDSTYNQSRGVLASVQAGWRFADHYRQVRRWLPTLRTAATDATGVNTTGFANFPSNFGSGLNGGNWDRTGFYLTKDGLQDYISSQFKGTTPEFERRVAGEIDLRERQTAAFVMQNLEGNKWSGNVGLRFVQTQINAQIVTPVRNGLCPKIEPGQPIVACAAVPNAINFTGDGNTYYDGIPWNPALGTVYVKTPTDKKFKDVLPSLNLRFEVYKDMLVRVGASRTIGRQNYNVLGTGFGVPGCNAAGCTVTGPNPDLKPLHANNADLSWAWYFAKSSLAQVNLFSSKIDGYIKTGTLKQETTVDLVDPTDNVVKPFFVNSSSQQGAKIKGIELSYEQPIWGGFGGQVNWSRAKTKVDDGRPMVGASEYAANAIAYYENDGFSARLAVNYRGKYVASTTAPLPTSNSQGTSNILGVVQPTALIWAAPVTNVSLSMGYKINKSLSFNFDATNLTNPVRAQYRYSEDEPSKADVSGRQYYFSAKYRF